MSIAVKLFSRFILPVFFLLNVICGFSQAPLVGCVGALPFGNNIFVNGANLTGVTSISFAEGSPAVNSFTIDNDSHISVLVSASLYPGPHQIKLKNATDSTQFFFVTNYPPVIDSFSPAIIGPGDTLTLKGGALDGFPAIDILNSDLCAVQSSKISSGLNTQRQLLIENGCEAHLANFSWGLQQLGNCFYQTQPLQGLIFDATPIINSVTPLTAKAGDTVTITGKYLAPGLNYPDVKFGGIPASKVLVYTTTQVKAIVGNGASGDITLTNNYNVTDTFLGFVYQPTICPNGNSSLNSSLVGNAYQWQLDSGSGFINITNNANYSGTTEPMLSLSNIPSAWYGYKYRCMVDGIPTSDYTIVFNNKWTGNSNNMWNNPANWSCGTVPDANTDVIINNGPVIINGNAFCRSIKIAPGVNFTISTGGNLIVSH